MTKRTNKEQKIPGKLMTLKEVKAMMIQLNKDAALPSLLYVTRKLGEVEGMISMQEDPDKALVAIQGDLKRLHSKLVDDAGIELIPELGHAEQADSLFDDNPRSILS